MDEMEMERILEWYTRDVQAKKEKLLYRYRSILEDAMACGAPAEYESIGVAAAYEVMMRLNVVREYLDPLDFAEALYCLAKATEWALEDDLVKRAKNVEDDFIFYLSQLEMAVAARQNRYEMDCRLDEQEAEKEE